MNYIKCYINLIRKAQNRTINGYLEKHHIFPISIFGKNNNTVRLTFREHYIAHRLLARICELRYGMSHPYSRKMNMAIHRMIYSSKDKIPIRTSRMYDIARTAVINAKIGKTRDDLKGKAYFGADPEMMRSKIKQAGVNRRGIHTNYPKHRRPLSGRTYEVFDKISNSRQHTKLKYKNMSPTEFDNWLRIQDLYIQKKNIDKRIANPNVTRALDARGYPLSMVYNENDFSKSFFKKSKNRARFYGL